MFPMMVFINTKESYFNLNEKDLKEKFSIFIKL